MDGPGALGATRGLRALAGLALAATIFGERPCGAPVSLADAPDEARTGSTIVDLSDDWAPVIFAEAPEPSAAGSQPYRSTYVALADERAGPIERDLELFGIFPTFRVLRERWLDETRHACHRDIDPEALAELERAPPRFDERARERQRSARREAMFLLRRLGDEAVRRGLSSIEDLRADETLGPQVARRAMLARGVVAIEAMQARLRCDRFLPTDGVESGVFDAMTVDALRRWQRREMLIWNGHLDPHTLELLRKDSLERTFRTTLRALRERVVDAMGTIEDGSASAAGAAVLGRFLDPPELHATEALPPLLGGARDVVSAATEDAARALGWIDPAATRAAFAAMPADRTRRWRVSLPLPSPPLWHSAAMDLRAEIDRGDVWYAFPFTREGAPRRSPVRRRPTLTLRVLHEGAMIPLVRWSTTIGGWKSERLPNGRVGLRYKESPVGPRVWRDLIASPAWLPPPTTPDEELVRRAPGGDWEASSEIARPGYQSAYGLAMLVHHSVALPLDRESEDETRRWLDEGVRTHGSVAYGSVLRGTSHGCHRLFNHLAVRLAGFLLRHRPHVRRGALPVRYARTLRHRGRTMELRVDTRGYLYELTPPVPVNVLEGNVLGSVRRPLRGLRPLPD